MRLSILSTVLLTSRGLSVVSAGSLVTPENIASSLSLTVSTSLPFPTATLSPSDADDFLVNNWSLNKHKIQNQPSDIEFVSDPFPNSQVNPVFSPSASSSSLPSPVLQVTYPQGSFEDSDGGVQFYSLFNGSLASPQTMLLSYELAFGENFQWVKGGKLPGLRGGDDTDGCEGGSLPNGTNCWSSRLMWRTSGQAEIYTYIPTTDRLCSDAEVICNSDFGTSLNRGAVSFTPATWMQVALLVQLNSRGTLANGNMAFYFNGALITNQTNLQIRSSTDLTAGGLFFSTFFGGNDPSWATPTTQNTFFRNFRLWTSENPSNLIGIPVSSSTQRNPTCAKILISFTALIAFISNIMS